MITTYLSELFETHGLSPTIYNGWIVPDAEFPAIRAFWYPNNASGSLEVEILVRDNVIIHESFGGFGEGDQGLRDGLMNFTINSFHVLLAAFWGKNDPDQVITEHWEVNGKRYTAYIGNFGTRNSASVAPDIPSDLFPSIQEVIQREPLTSDIHWFRFFFANLAREFTFEALKDNEIWDAGVRCLKNTSWLATEGFYSVRLFMILRAA